MLDFLDLCLDQADNSNMIDHNTDEVLKSLETGYVQGEFDKVEKLLIENKDKFDRGLFHYNLGSIHLKKQDFAIGRYHLERAIKEGFVGNQVINNLQYVKSKLNIESEEASYTLKDIFYSNVLKTPKEIVLGGYLSLTLLILIVIKSKILNLKKVSTLLGFVFLILPFVIWLYMQISYKGAVSLGPAPIKEGPSSVFQEIGQLAPGSMVLIEKSKDGWSFVASPTKYLGWVQSKDLGFL